MNPRIPQDSPPTMTPVARMIAVRAIGVSDLRITESDEAKIKSGARIAADHAGNFAAAN